MRRMFEGTELGLTKRVLLWIPDFRRRAPKYSKPAYVLAARERYSYDSQAEGGMRAVQRSNSNVAGTAAGKLPLAAA